MDAVLGAGGFIGGHYVRFLESQGLPVKATDVKPYEEWHQLPQLEQSEKLKLDLKSSQNCQQAIAECNRVFNFAADMGGMGFIANHKVECMMSVLISTHALQAACDRSCTRYFYASSACVYPGYRQDVTDVSLKEADAYPADPEDGYGWEKLFSERLCRHFYEDYGFESRVARFHNVYGPYGTYDGGREKAPAAICRKVIEAKLSGDYHINIWGDGEQTRSFMYIDDCIEGVNRLMCSDVHEPLNVGSSELVTVNELVDLVEEIAGGIKLKRIYDLSAPQGVRGRNSDNTLIKKLLGWEPTVSLAEGMARTYEWIYNEIHHLEGQVTGMAPVAPS